MIKQTKGITLIALVITIIVLLILAGVTIATLTGDNGLLQKATSAKQSSEAASALEKIKVEVAGSYDLNGKLDINQLNKNLKKIPGLTYNNNEIDETDESKRINTLPATIQLDKNEYDINEFGNINKSLKLGKAIDTEKYGWKVQDYNIEMNETGGWRLFYKDTDYTYLISNNSISLYSASDYYTNYTNGSEVSLEGQKLNSKISTLFVKSNTNNNIKFTAWLTDTSTSGIWNKYKNEDVEFAIGSPTIELFAASYNNKKDKTNIITLDSGTYGYQQNTSQGWFQTDNHCIYNNGTSWWIASPYYNDFGWRAINVSSAANCFGYDYISTKNSIRPIVCISTLVFNNKYEKSLIDE